MTDSFADGDPVARMVGLACLEEGVEFVPSIPGIGPIRGIGAPTVGAPVRMLGRTSGLARGKIEQVDATIEIRVVRESFRFVDTIVTSAMSEAGDGGALVVDEEGYAIGIVVAGSQNNTLLAPLQDTLDRLNVQLVVSDQGEE
jgi:hypothetical protein